MKRGNERRGPGLAVGERPLTPKRERFVAEFLLDLNAAAAARRAGYSPRTARQTGHRLLTKADIQAALTVAQQERAERVKVAVDDVLRKLVECGLKSDRRDAMTIRFVELLGKHLGMFSEQVEVTEQKVLVVPDVPRLLADEQTRELICDLERRLANSLSGGEGDGAGCGRADTEADAVRAGIPG